jgi:hypothetical protein
MSLAMNLWGKISAKGLTMASGNKTNVTHAVECAAMLGHLLDNK